MIIKYYDDPVPHLIITNLFDKKTSSNMMNEIIKLESNFTNGKVGGSIGTGIMNKQLRTNKVLFIDILFPDRTKSIILSEIDNLFSNNKEFREVLASSPNPISDFILTNKHETQISRYGNNEFYGWHVDRSDMSRHVTAVYYFDDGKNWTGGNLQITKSPIYNDKPIDKKLKIKNIKPIPNSMVIFGSAIPHRVTQTKSPKEFKKGRFSANIWIGFK